jgi:hypothetical protein
VRRPRKSLPPSIATDCKYWGAVKEESYKRWWLRLANCQETQLISPNTPPPQHQTPFQSQVSN